VQKGGFKSEAMSVGVVRRRPIKQPGNEKFANYCLEKAGSAPGLMSDWIVLYR
jgi:hypothetical protein